jgi:vacuolar-type H+-ATPase subunit H
MNFKKVTLPLILSLSFLFVACQQSTQAPDNEGIESQIEKAGEEAGKALEEAGKDMGKALEDAKKATEEGLDDADKAVEESVREAGKAIENVGDSVRDVTN